MNAIAVVVGLGFLTSGVVAPKGGEETVEGKDCVVGKLCTEAKMCLGCTCSPSTTLLHGVTWRIRLKCVEEPGQLKESGNKLIPQPGKQVLAYHSCDVKSFTPASLECDNVPCAPQSGMLIGQELALSKSHNTKAFAVVHCRNDPMKGLIVE